jgi:hypothetical protein
MCNVELKSGMLLFSLFSREIRIIETTYEPFDRDEK